MKAKEKTKKKPKNLRILVYVLVILTFILFGYLLSTHSEKVLKKANVTEITDGDTIGTSLGKVRFLGINTPEKGQYYYTEAKEFLSQLNGKEVTLEVVSKDMFNRTLAYVFYQGKLVEEEILSQGFGHYYSYSADEYSSKLKADETKARLQEIGIWKKSQDECAKCISLVEINKKDPGEYVLFKNTCDYDCDLHNWTLKDETASHLFKLDFSINPGKEKHIYFDYAVWNDDHDSLFLRDNSGLLVIFYRY